MKPGTSKHVSMMTSNEPDRKKYSEVDEVAGDELHRLSVINETSRHFANILTPKRSADSSGSMNPPLRRIITDSPRLSRKTISEMVVDHYRIVFAIAICLELLPLILSAVLCFDKDYKLFPVDFNGVPMIIQNDPSYRRYVASLNKRMETVPTEAERINVARSTRLDCLQVIYEGDNVLSKQSLITIKNIEKWLTDWDNPKILSLIKNDTILKPKSPLRYLDGTKRPDLIDTDFNNIAATLSKAYRRPEFVQEIGILISKDAKITPQEATSQLTQSIFCVGKEVFRYVDSMADFWEQFFLDKLNQLTTNGKPEFKRIYFFNARMYYEHVKKQVNSDFRLIVGSFLFIVLFVLIQTQSIFITLTGISSILISFIWTNYIYRVMLGYSYFGIFHVMSLFIILGIGSDDLFVFYDMWRITACMELDTIAERLSYCYSKATVSMTITSVTTALAFASSIVSPLYGLSSFALFSGILVMINYLSAVFIFPVCVLVYHKDIEPHPWPWAKLYQSNKVTPETLEPNIVVRFFRTSMTEFLTHRIYKWVLIISSTCFAIFFALHAYQLEVSKKEIQYLKPGSNYQDAHELVKFHFKENLDDNRIKVQIVFGIREQDFTACDYHDYKCQGIFHYDDSLDLNPVEAQKKLLAACQILESQTNDSDLHLTKENNITKVSCFIKQMDIFFKTYSQSLKGVNVYIPITGVKYYPLVMARQDVYNRSTVNDNFYRFFETAAMFWITNGHTGNRSTGENYTADVILSQYLGMSSKSEDFFVIEGTSGPDLGVASLMPTEADTSDFIHKFYGLKYFIIELPIDLRMGCVDYRMGLAAYEAWENVTQELMKTLPPSLQGFQIASKNEWHSFLLSKTMLDSAIRGIALGLVLAFIVVTIATNNLIISTLATVTILLVVITFAGFIHIFGWNISIIESINLSLVTGLSVDYVVHMSGSYHHAPHDTRELKVRDMLEEMGISVLSGAITTAGAATFMLEAKIYFFFQFGAFILATIGLSLFYTLFWFTPLMSVLGPEGDTGSLSPIYKWLWQMTNLTVNGIAEGENHRHVYATSISYFGRSDARQASYVKRRRSSFLQDEM